MRQTKKAVAKYAGASAIALLLATSVFAAPAQWQGRSRATSAQPAAAQQSISHAVSDILNGQSNRQTTQPQRNGGYGQQGQQPQQQPQRNGGYGQHGQQPQQQPQPQRNGGYGQYSHQTQQQPQRQYSQPQRDTRPAYNGSYRQNERVNRSGRITSMMRDRDGYRVQLDRGDAFWIPSSRLGNRAGDLRVGVSISLGGIFNGGMINVDAVSWPGGYQQGYISGIVQAIDYRSGTLELRDNASGSLIAVDMRSMQGGNLRPGDLVTLSGNWVGGNVFDAYRIDSIS